MAKYNIYTYHLYLFYMAIQIQHSSCQIQCFINLRVETYWHHTTKKLFLDRHSKKTTLLEWVLWIINCTTKVSTRNNLHPCKLSQWFSLFQRSSKSLLDQLIAWHFIWAVQWVCRNELLYTHCCHFGSKSTKVSKLGVRRKWAYHNVAQPKGYSKHALEYS